MVEEVTARERVDQRFEEIAGKVTTAPIPENAVLPDWMLDGGMQHLEEFFSATAEVWDETIRDSGRG